MSSTHSPTSRVVVPFQVFGVLFRDPPHTFGKKLVIYHQTISLISTMQDHVYTLVMQILRYIQPCFGEKTADVEVLFRMRDLYFVI